MISKIKDKLLEIKNKIMSIKSWRSILILGVGLGIGLILDVFVKVTKIVLIPVGEDYLNEVFGAACSVAVLGNAMLSLLFGSIDKAIHGIPFQDVLKLSGFGDDQRLTIVATTSSIIFAIAAYTWELYTLLTLIVCADAFLILSSSLDIWNIHSDKEKQEKTINEIVSRAPAIRYEVYVKNWFNELELALPSNGDLAVRGFCDMIDELTVIKAKEEHLINAMMGRHLPQFFEIACERVGFTQAYRFFKQINHIRPEGFVDCETTALDYIKSLKYINGINTHNRSVPQVVKEIIGDVNFSAWEIKAFVHQYINAIFYNPYLAIDTKTELLSEIMNVLCKLRDESEDEIRKEIIFEIVKNDILLNENQENRQMLFKILTESLVRKNRYVKDKIYIATIAEIFLAFFFYTFQEKEALSNSYREGLRRLYQAKLNKKDLIDLSFNYLIFDNCKEIANYLSENAADFNWRKSAYWDYYGPAMGFKRIIWSQENVVVFSFCFYKMIESACDNNPFVQILESDNYSDDTKLAICKAVSELFEQGQLNSIAHEMISHIEILIGMNLWKGFRDQWEHNYFQDKLSKLITAQNQNSGEMIKWPITEINQLVNQKLEQYGVFKFNASLPVRPATRRRLEPMLVEMNSSQPKQSAHRIAQSIRTIMNGVIAQKLSKIEVDFGMEGVQNLYEALKDQKWQYRNYQHTNDYAMPASVKETKEFAQLCDILDSIDYDSSREITPYVFLKGANVHYNMDIHYQLVKPSEEACAQFVNRHRIANGVYRIGTNPFDYSHAIKHVKDNYMLELTEVFVHVDVGADSGFKVEIRREK